MKTKEALQAELNERAVKAEMKRQNVLDASMSRHSVSVSDHSRVTGFGRQATTNQVDSEIMANEEIGAFGLNLVRMRSNDPRAATTREKRESPFLSHPHLKTQLSQTSRDSLAERELLHMQTNNADLKLAEL